MSDRPVRTADNRNSGSALQRPRIRPALLLLALLLAAVALQTVSPPCLAANRNAGWPGRQAAPDHVRAEIAAATAEAKALMRERRFDAALALLRRLVGQYPEHPNARFLLGLAARGAARKPGLEKEAREALLDEAAAAFRFMLIDRPGLVRVRLELARTFFHKREDSLAREHFERVLAGRPHPAVAANVHRFLGAMRARKRWSLYAGAAMAPDTNVGRRSGERIIYLRGLPFRRSEESLPRSGVGLSVWGGGEYQFPLGRRLRLRAGGSISQREYAGAEFDRTFLSNHVGPRWLLDATTEASLLASARRLWRAGVPDFDEYGVRAEASRRFGRRMTAAVLASWHGRRHRLNTRLDGPVIDASMRAALVATPVIRLNAAAGWGRERPEAAAAKRFRHTRWWVQPGVSADLPWGVTLGGSAQWRRASFDGSFGLLTVSGKPRRDRGLTLRLSVNKRDWTLFGFSPRLSLVNEQRTSNTQGAGYRRTGAELSIVRQF